MIGVDKSTVSIISISLIIGMLLGYLFVKYSKDDKCEILVSPEGEGGGSGSEITVELSGAVNSPGLYRMSASSRIGELIKMGGGLSEETSGDWVAKNLNLADKLEDEQKVYVPFERDVYIPDCVDLSPLPVITDVPVSPIVSDSDNSGSASEEGRLNVNAASLEDLEGLTGIGPSYASKIVEGRPYENFAELVEKSEVPTSTLEKIEEQIAF
jgi:competence protein ComEA